MTAIRESLNTNKYGIAAVITLGTMVYWGAAKTTRVACSTFLGGVVGGALGSFIGYFFGRTYQIRQPHHDPEIEIDGAVLGALTSTPLSIIFNLVSAGFFNKNSIQVPTGSAILISSVICILYIFSGEMPSTKSQATKASSSPSHFKAQQLIEGS